MEIHYEKKREVKNRDFKADTGEAGFLTKIADKTR